MKWKIAACAVVLVLILAQIIYGGRKAPSDPVSGAAAVQAAEGQPRNAAPAGEPATPPPPPPSPDDVTAIAIGDMRLSRSGDGWVLPDEGGAPADGEKVRTLLHSLLVAPRSPVPPGDEESTGLGGGGLTISLTLGDGSAYDVLLGLRPAGSYGSAYVRFPGDGVNVVSGDIRGDLGLWRNVSGAELDPSAWLEKRALTFYVSDVVRIEATYPDHHIVFEKSPEGLWQPRDYVPGGVWEREGLIAWLTDLSEFQIAGIVPSDEFSHDDTGKTHGLVITLSDGQEKTVRVQPNHGGEGMLAVTSDYPGRVFHLAEWRFKKYFRRLPSLFPSAVPNYELSQVRFIDILRGGEKVKIARRDGSWRPVALHYPLRADQIDRLARLLSSWRPEDYAAPDPKAIRPHYGSPMVEVTLESGDVHQYRLAGRHPLFPWRYVTLNGKEIFSVTDPEAGVMFPGFAEVLDLGRVFHRMTLEDVDSVQVAALDGTMDLFFLRNTDGSWSINAGEGYEVELTALEAERILGELSQWRVSGFYDVDAHPARQAQYVIRYMIRMGVTKAGEQEVTILQPEDRDIPYLTESGRGYLIDRADFQNWFGAVREAGDRLDREKKRVQEEEREREAKAAAAESAEPENAPSDAESVEDDGDGISESSAPEEDRLPDGDSRDDPVAPNDGESISPPEAEEAGDPEEPTAEVEPVDAPEPEEEEEAETPEEHPTAAPEGALDVERVATGSENEPAETTEEAIDEALPSNPEIVPEAEKGTESSEEYPEERISEVLGETGAAPTMAEDADDSEETAGEPAGGDVLIHSDVDENVVGPMTEEVTGEDSALVPEAEVIHNDDAVSPAEE